MYYIYFKNFKAKRHTILFKIPVLLRGSPPRVWQSLAATCQVFTWKREEREVQISGIWSLPGRWPPITKYTGFQNSWLKWDGNLALHSLNIPALACKIPNCSGWFAQKGRLVNKIVHNIEKSWENQGVNLGTWEPGTHPSHMGESRRAETTTADHWGAALTTLPGVWCLFWYELKKILYTGQPSSLPLASVPIIRCLTTLL